LYGYIENSVRVARAARARAGCRRDARAPSAFRLPVHGHRGTVFSVSSFRHHQTTRLTHINYLNSYSKSMSIQVSSNQRSGPFAPPPPLVKSNAAARGAPLSAIPGLAGSWLHFYPRQPRRMFTFSFTIGLLPVTSDPPQHATTTTYATTPSSTGVAPPIPAV